MSHEQTITDAFDRIGIPLMYAGNGDGPYLATVKPDGTRYVRPYIGKAQAERAASKFSYARAVQPKTWRSWAVEFGNECFPTGKNTI